MIKTIMSRRFTMRSAVCVAIAAGAMMPQVGAQTLSNQLQGVFGERGITLAVGNPAFTHTAHFSSVSLATLGLLAQQLAPSAADFPAISTVPGLTFRYNADIQAFERSSNSLGSIYVERPQTLGRGKFDFGISYLHLDFAGLNGTDLDKLAFNGLRHGECCNGAAFEDATASVSFNRFELTSHVMTLSGTYGITDNWDVNVLLPVIVTTMDLSATAQINDVPFDPDGAGPQNFPQGVHFFPNNTKQQTVSSSDEQAGVGDLQLRTKYHFLSDDSRNAAAGFNLRLPTGNAMNFQGLDDVVLSPYVAMAQEFGQFDVHGILGFDVYGGNVDRSRVRYALGGTYQPVENVALIADVIGSSSLSTQTVTETVPEFDGFSTVPTGFERVSRSFPTDIVDLALGVKFTPHKSLVGFVNVFVPLNDDGLRPDVVPSGGVQMSF